MFLCMGLLKKTASNRRGWRRTIIQNVVLKNGIVKCICIIPKKRPKLIKSLKKCQQKIILGGKLANFKNSMIIKYSN